MLQKTIFRLTDFYAISTMAKRYDIFVDLLRVCACKCIYNGVFVNTFTCLGFVGIQLSEHFPPDTNGSTGQQKGGTYTSSHVHFFLELLVDYT